MKQREREREKRVCWEYDLMAIAKEDKREVKKYRKYRKINQ